MTKDVKFALPWSISSFEVNADGTQRVIMGSDGFAVAYLMGRTVEEHQAIAEFILDRCNHRPAAEAIAAWNHCAAAERSATPTETDEMVEMVAFALAAAHDEISVSPSHAVLAMRNKAGMTVTYWTHLASAILPQIKAQRDREIAASLRKDVVSLKLGYRFDQAQTFEQIADALEAGEVS